ncbi:MAG: hypothetical protein KDI55_19245 [Anaerolineae bacterium]|nr:hypothetical protein [Anaerolineae bacterium]
MTRRAPVSDIPAQAWKTGMNAVLDILERAGGRGATVSEIAARRGIKITSVANSMARLASYGHVVRRALAYHDQRWYLREHAPPASAAKPKKIKQLAVINDPRARTTTVAKARLALPPGGEVIVPATARYTYAPFPADPRYTADPSVAGRGAITEDWMARRQQQS